MSLHGELLYFREILRIFCVGPLSWKKTFIVLWFIVRGGNRDLKIGFLLFLPKTRITWNCLGCVLTYYLFLHLCGFCLSNWHVAVVSGTDKAFLLGVDGFCFYCLNALSPDVTEIWKILVNQCVGNWIYTMSRSIRDRPPCIENHHQSDVLSQLATL